MGEGGLRETVGGARGEPALVHRRLLPRGVEVAFVSPSAPAYLGRGQGEVQQVRGEPPPECGAGSAETAVVGAGNGDHVLDVGLVSIGIAETESGHWIARFADIDLGIIDHKTKKLHCFRAARPGRPEAKRTENTVTHVTGL